MSRFNAVFISLCLSFAPALANAQTNHNLRLLFHGTRAIADSSNFSLAGWVIACNVPKVPNKWLTIIGPRYNGKDWWVEAMGGFFIQGEKSNPLIDVRASLDKFKPFTAWTNFQWVYSPKKERSFYGYLQVDRQLPYNLGRAGVETENTFKIGEDDLSVGPHLIVPFNSMAMVFAYQFHRRAPNQIWVRMLVNL